MTDYFYIGWFQCLVNRTMYSRRMAYTHLLRKGLVTTTLSRETYSRLLCRDYDGGQKARFSQAMFRATDNLRTKYHKMTTPFLMMMTSTDQFVSVKGMKEFYDQASSRDKTIVFLNSGLHHFYIEKPEIRNIAINKAIEWIDRRV